MEEEYIMKDSIVINGKCYKLIQGDNNQTKFITKFYDKPIDTLCVTETELLYIPSNEWMKIDKKTLECFIKAFRIVGYDLNKYNESIYFAIYKPTKFDVDTDTLSELIKSREWTLF